MKIIVHDYMVSTRPWGKEIPVTVIDDYGMEHNFVASESMLHNIDQYAREYVEVWYAATRSVEPQIDVAALQDAALEAIRSLAMVSKTSLSTLSAEIDRLSKAEKVV